MNITDIFSDKITKVFRVTNFYESNNIYDHIIEPTVCELIPKSEYDTYIYVRALLVFENYVEECFMDLSLPDRLPEFVIKLIDNKIIETPIYTEKNSVIPAIASEQSGNPELYFAKENPAVGIEVLKHGKLINPNSDAIKDDLAYIYDMLGKNISKIKIRNIEDAIKIIINTSILHVQASSEGNYRLANKNFDKREKALEYIKQNNEFKKLSSLLISSLDEVRLYAAQIYINTEFNEDAINVFKELKDKTGIISLIAKTNLMELNGEKDC